MQTIRIVKNSDRCHVLLDGVPVATFHYINYREHGSQAEHHALHDAKAQCFNSLAELNRLGIAGNIDTKY